MPTRSRTRRTMTACASKDDQVTKTSTLAAAAATLFLAAACSSTPGTPSPAPSNAGSVPSGTAPTSSDTTPGVPKVSAPLNAAKYEQDPCSLLTKEQAGQFIGGLRTSSKDSNSPACTWNGENGDSIGVTFIPNQGGLATIYKNGRNGGSAYFEPHGGRGLSCGVRRRLGRSQDHRVSDLCRNHRRRGIRGFQQPSDEFTAVRKTVSCGA